MMDVERKPGSNISLDSDTCTKCCTDVCKCFGFRPGWFICGGGSGREGDVVCGSLEEVGTHLYWSPQCVCTCMWGI